MRKSARQSAPPLTPSLDCALHRFARQLAATCTLSIGSRSTTVSPINSRCAVRCSNSEAIDRAFRDFLSRISRIDATKVAHVDPNKFGQTIRIALLPLCLRSDWPRLDRGTARDKEALGADFAALHGLAELVVIAVPLPQKAPDLESLTKALLATVASITPIVPFTLDPVRWNHLRDRKFRRSALLAGRRFTTRCTSSPTINAPSSLPAP